MEIKAHPFFKSVDWVAMSERRVKPQFKPKTRNEKDTGNIDKQFLGERPVDSPTANQLTFSQKEKAYFDQFTYNREDQDFLM